MRKREGCDNYRHEIRYYSSSGKLENYHSTRQKELILNSESSTFFVRILCLMRYKIIKKERKKKWNLNNFEES